MTVYYPPSPLGGEGDRFYDRIGNSSPAERKSSKVMDSKGELHWKWPEYGSKHYNKAYLGNFEVNFLRFCARRRPENHFDSSKTSGIDLEWYC